MQTWKAESEQRAANRRARESKKLTYRKATLEALEYFELMGWSVSSDTIKIPHATEPVTGFRVWFKSQATYCGYTTKLGDARSLHVDRRHGIDMLISAVEGARS